jgi:hypothetical protein
MERVAVPVRPCASRAASVITCEPTDRLLFEKDVPVPIWPSRLLVHVSDAPVSEPLSGSLPVPANATLVPCTALPPFEGDVIVAVGALLADVGTCTALVMLFGCPLPSVTVNVTLYVPTAA